MQCRKIKKFVGNNNSIEQELVGAAGDLNEFDLLCNRCNFEMDQDKELDSVI